MVAAELKPTGNTNAIQMPCCCFLKFLDYFSFLQELTLSCEQKRNINFSKAGNE